MHQCIDQCPGVAASTGMHHHAGRFIDRDHVIILIKDFERQILWFGVERCKISRLYLNLL